jgi:hypothetical protein
VYSADGGDTVGGALAEASAYDVIQLDGDFPAEAEQLHVPETVTIEKWPAAADKPVIRTRLIYDCDVPVVRDVVLHVHPPESGEGTSVQNTSCLAPSFVRVGFTNGASGGNVGTVDGLEFIYGDRSVDPAYIDCDFFENGDFLDGFSRVHVHGIYIQNSIRPYVYNSRFRDNAGRQVQLYPNCQQGTIYKCQGWRSNEAVDFGGDVGMSLDTTLAAPLGAADATVALTDATTWPDSVPEGTAFLLIGGEYIPYLGKLGSVIALDSDSHGAYSAGTVVKLYTRSCYNTVEDCIFGHTGNDERTASDGQIYAWWSGSSTAPRGLGNEVLNNWLHDPATAGTVPMPPDTRAYIDTREGGFINAGGNVLGVDPLYVDPEGRDFTLQYGSPAAGYGPDSIQPPSQPTYDLGSILSDETWRPTQPGAGVRPRAGLVPGSSGVEWFPCVLVGGIGSAEAWGEALLHDGHIYSLVAIASAEDWDAPPGLAPRVGLYPGAGLHPKRSGLSWADIQHPGSILDASAWGATGFLVIDAVNKVVRGVMSSALALTRSQPFR